VDVLERRVQGPRPALELPGHLLQTVDDGLGVVGADERRRRSNATLAFSAAAAGSIATEKRAPRPPLFAAEFSSELPLPMRGRD
jgi:hypothetical protein